MFVVTFASVYNPDLAEYDKSFVKMEISDADSIDDIVFDLRRGIAESLGIRMTRVYLMQNGRKVLNGADMERPLMASEVMKMVEEGVLTFCLQKRNPITESQVDFLVEEWGSKLERECSTEEMMEKEKAAMRNSREFKSFGDDMMKNSHSILSDVKIDTDVIELRRSLDNVLQDIETKAGLSDVELQEHLSKINVHSQSLSQEWSDHMKKVRTLSIVRDTSLRKL